MPPFPEGVPLLFATCAVSAAVAAGVALALRRSLAPGSGQAPREPGAAPDADARSILDALPDAIVERDGAGRITFRNAAYQRLLAEAGATDGGPDASLRATETTLVATRPDGTRAVEEALQTEAGLRWFAWTERDVVRDGRRASLRSGREITQRVANARAVEDARARAEAASEAKSRFLATVSHEFRTPLNGIVGMSDLLVETSLEPEQLSYVQAIRGSAEAFLSLVGEILDFSRIEAGHVDLATEIFAVEPLVQGVVELLSPRAQDKGIEIACRVADDVPVTVEADRDRLRQVLFNLAGNAVKFTDTGGVGVTVERGRDDVVVFRVEDTGPGIPADQLPLIFEDFEQGGLQAARGAGTGLGLAISRRIAERMGGRITVDSEPGRGSVFRLTLPLPGRSAVGRARSADGLRVLVVGGSPFGPAFLANQLAEAGAETARASTPAEATDLLRAARFDVAIMDWALGPAIRDVLADAKRRGVARTIVLLSPFERRAVGSPAAAGFDAYLMKPVRPGSLIAQLRPARAPAAVPPRPALRPDRPRPDRVTRVLLAEDNEINALLAMKVLEKLGGLVDWARDGIEALRLAEEGLSGSRPPYDLVLMDMRMPGLDGSEVTRRIRDRETAAGRDERCRIVALTASLVGGRERYTETAGFDGFLPKPFTFDALRAQFGPADHAQAS